MIEINLLPGTEKRKKRKAGAGFALKLPESMPALDRIMAFIVVAWIVGPLLTALLFFGVRGDLADAEERLAQVRADSVRYARVIETQTELQARQDTIAQKLTMIQEIDAARYIWPHILDEISRALPPYTWLETVDQNSGGAQPEFMIAGRTGSLPALTRFMDALEASPFLRNIQLVSSEQAIIGGDAARVVNNFALTGSYRQPPTEMIETVPLFVDGAADNGGEVGDAAGSS